VEIMVGQRAKSELGGGLMTASKTGSSDTKTGRSGDDLLSVSRRVDGRLSCFKRLESDYEGRGS